jgi:predicted Zn-dependent peptidase
MLTDSQFAPEDIALESGVILQEISRHDDSPSSVMHDALQAVSYPDQTFGRTILGSTEFVKTAVGDNFRAFTEQFYTAVNTAVVGVGGIDHDRFVKQVETAFSRMPSRTTPRPPPARYVGGLSIDRSRDFKQVTAGIAFDAVPVLDERMYHYSLLADAFGGGMSSPLVAEIREKRGLVYSTGCYASLGVDNGRIIISGGMTPDNVKEFVSVASAEFRKMTDAISETDLRRAKNSNLTSIATLQEKPYSTACFMARSYWQRGRVRSLEEMRAAVEAVTLDDLKAAAAHVLASAPSVALVGPVPDLDYVALVNGAA